MSSLGERLAVAYGWKPIDPINIPGYIDKWRDGDGADQPTPDPKDYWDDFGAMLQWFENTGPDLMDLVRDSGSTTSTLAEWRAEVIEGILEVVET